MNHNYWIAFGALFIVVLAARALLRISPGTKSAEMPYVRKNQLLTKSELRFFEVLNKVVPIRFHITVKPRLADLFEVRAGTKKWQSWFNRIQAKHVDFLLCRSTDMHPVLAIELDDSSHRRTDRLNRDSFVNDLFGQTGLPLLRISVQRRYDAEELRLQITDSVG